MDDSGVSRRTVVAVTGANGFVGTAVASAISAQGFAVRRIVREKRRLEDVPVGELGPKTEIASALVGVDTVVHCAARVHMIRDQSDDPLKEFRRTNVDGTRRLAQEAAKSGARRLIFLSSVKVNGEITGVPGAPDKFRPSDEPAPCDAYAISKYEAEQVLAAIGSETGLETVVIRPPLVYGPGVRANFLRLMQLVAHGFPIPLGMIHNRRSLVYLENLASLVVECISNSAAIGRTLLVSDGDDLSTPDLVRRIARSMGRRPRLIPVPSSLLCAVASMIGRRGELQRLIASLQVDIDPTCRYLNWAPQYTIEKAIDVTVQDFLRVRS